MSASAELPEVTYRCVVVSNDKQLGASVAASLALPSFVVVDLDPTALSTGAFAEVDVVCVVDAGSSGSVELVGEIVRASAATLPPIIVAARLPSPALLESVTSVGAYDLLSLEEGAVAIRHRLLVHARAHRALVAARASSMSGEFFEKNPFAYFIVRSGGRIQRVNGRFNAITGFATSDVDGKQIEDLLSRANPHEVYGYHREKIRHQEKAFEYECTLLHHQGHEIRVVLSMNIVVAGGFGIGALHDVTEARRLQKEIENRNKLLEESTTRLRETQEELNRTTRLATLGEISAQVAHEVLNPLTAVNARLRKMRDASVVVDELVTYARDAAGAMAASATADQRDLLDSVPVALAETNSAMKADITFVVAELGRVQKLVDGMRSATPTERVMSRMPLIELLRYAEEVMADPLERSKVKLSFTSDDDIVVTVDRGEFIQVITNLVRNSIEALASLPETTRREVTIAATETGGTARIVIRDSGTGVPKDMEGLIFEPSYTSKRTGTGIGLPISRRLIRAYGGDLAFDASAPPPGATFVITLAATRAAAGAPGAPGWKG